MLALEGTEDPLLVLGNGIIGGDEPGATVKVVPTPDYPDDDEPASGEDSDDPGDPR